jgi:hypothetical protein
MLKFAGISVNLQSIVIREYVTRIIKEIKMIDKLATAPFSVSKARESKRESFEA